MSLNRRTFLRASGVTLSLPFLEAMNPSQAAIAAPNRRMVAINLPLGLHSPNLVPNKTGNDYEVTPYLKQIADLREHFTIISGTSHPGVDGGHATEKSFLTSAPHPNSPSFRNSISLDQVAAAKVGSETRFGYLSLSCGGGGLSWSRSGVQIPAQISPSKLFAQLFLEGKPEEKARQIQRLKDGQSIMDRVMDQARRMSGDLASQDREKLDEYFTAVRETEKRLVKAEDWSSKPKPKVDAEQPRDINDRTDVIGKSRLMYDMMNLAL